MSAPETNGKSLLGLYLQVVSVIAAIATPLILMYAKMNAMEVHMQEIETQFKAADDYRNMNLTNNLRFTSLLWQRSYGEPFPAEVYYPSISNRK